MEVCTADKKNESQSEQAGIHLHESEGWRWNGEYAMSLNTWDQLFKVMGNVEER